ncbi:hypothetical protein T4C_4552 [Trichinella pseudospiralis]|uniref:Uncharacterized protein n=1 Tax=Trichinella pseudospiralis TaxID=6337 RepID=A0A0V1JWN2_TRIPS|nr:hypothetical protein T4C_4552 [Trichinella pseudospiralis]
MASGSTGDKSGSSLVKSASKFVTSFFDFFNAFVFFGLNGGLTFFDSNACQSTSLKNTCARTASSPPAVSTQPSQWKLPLCSARPDKALHPEELRRTNPPRCQLRTVAGRPSFRTSTPQVPTSPLTHRNRSLSISHVNYYAAYLGGDVIRRTAECRSQLFRTDTLFAHTKIGQLDMPVCIEQNVVQFQISEQKKK